MSDDREMHVNDERSPKRCRTCNHVKMTMEGQPKCPNCDVKGESTGQTIIITEPKGEKGPVTIQRVSSEELKILEAQQILAMRKAATTGIASLQVSEPIKPGMITLHVPVQLFPDLVMWSRKLKLPKDWKEAEKIKAITDFQIEINSKLGGLS